MLLQGPPPPPLPPQAMGNPPFGPCIECVPIDFYAVLLLFVALCYGFYKLVNYGDNNK